METTCGRESIIVVEDDALVASYVSEVLEELGFAIAGCASCGAEAIALAGRYQPRLALVDIHISGPMDGIEVAAVLRDRFKVVTIFLSGIRDQKIIDRANAVGASVFLQKPFRPSQVFSAIELALNPALQICNSESVEGPPPSQGRTDGLVRSVAGSPMVGRFFALADLDIRHRAQKMIEQYGAQAARRAVEELNAEIEAGDVQGRDRWAQIVCAIHVLTDKSP